MHFDLKEEERLYVAANRNGRILVVDNDKEIRDILSTMLALMDFEKVTPDMMRGLSGILDHIAEMMNNAPAYMMGTKSSEF